MKTQQYFLQQNKHLEEEIFSKNKINVLFGKASLLHKVLNLYFHLSITVVF